MRLRGDIALEDEAYRGRRTSRAAVFGEQDEAGDEEEDGDEEEVDGFLGSEGDGEDEEGEEEEEEADGRAAKRSRVAAGGWWCGGRGRGTGEEATIDMRIDMRMDMRDNWLVERERVSGWPHSTMYRLVCADFIRRRGWVAHCAAPPRWTRHMLAV